MKSITSNIAKILGQIKRTLIFLSLMLYFKKIMIEKTKKTTKEEMADAGLHFGHKTSKCHPKMMPYIEGVKGSVHIIDLSKTEEHLNQCLDEIKEIVDSGKILMIVSTKPQFKTMVKEMAEECDIPYVVDRFIGGMITNFNTIKKRIDYYNNILKQKESGEIEKYTKHEIVKIMKEAEGLEKRFGGVRKMERIPDAVFVTDMNKDKLTIKEAKMRNITVFGIADTDTNPEVADCFIPANDNSTASMKYILDKVKEVIKNKK